MPRDSTTSWEIHGAGAVSRVWLTNSFIMPSGLSSERVRQMMSSGQLRHEWTPYGRVVDPVALEALRVERERKKAGVS